VKPSAYSKFHLYGQREGGFRKLRLHCTNTFVSRTAVDKARAPLDLPNTIGTHFDLSSGLVDSSTNVLGMLSEESVSDCDTLNWNRAISLQPGI
jgi:hypothetical protein